MISLNPAKTRFSFIRLFIDISNKIIWNEWNFEIPKFLTIIHFQIPRIRNTRKVKVFTYLCATLITLSSILGWINQFVTNEKIIFEVKIWIKPVITQLQTENNGSSPTRALFIPPWIILDSNFFCRISMYSRNRCPINNFPNFTRIVHVSFTPTFAKILCKARHT